MGLPKDTMRHFSPLFTTKDTPDVIATLKGLSVVSAAHSSLFTTTLKPTKPLTMCIGASFDRNNTPQITSAIALNNFLSAGIRAEASLATTIKGGHLNPPIPGFSLQIPFFNKEGLHSFNVSSSQCTTDQTFPFVHSEQVTATSCSYTRPMFRITLTQASHTTTTHPDETLAGIPREILVGKDEQEYSCETSVSTEKKWRWWDISATFTALVGVFNDSCFIKPSSTIVLRTPTTRPCWFTTKVFAGLLVC